MAARPRLKVVAPKPFAAEGARFRAFVDARWGRADGGIRGLATEAGATPETLYAWFRGDNLPALGSARAIAKALGSTVLELVAAIEGQPVPSMKETPQPDWAGAMERRLRMELRLNRALIESDPNEILQLREALHGPERSEPPPDSPPRTGVPHPPGRAAGSAP